MSKPLSRGGTWPWPDPLGLRPLSLSGKRLCTRRAGRSHHMLMSEVRACPQGRELLLYFPAVAPSQLLLMGGPEFQTLVRPSLRVPG